MQTLVYVGASARTGGSISGMFRRGASDGAWVHAIEGFSDDTHVHPDDPAVVFAATSTGLYRSRDRGGRWSRLVESAAGEQIWSVLAHPADYRVVLTGCAPLAVYRGDDGGGNISAYASAVAGERMVGCFPSRIMRMSVDGSALYAAMEVNGAMLSDDGCENWVDCWDAGRACHLLSSRCVVSGAADGVVSVCGWWGILAGVWDWAARGAFAVWAGYRCLLAGCFAFFCLCGGLVARGGRAVVSEPGRRGLVGAGGSFRGRAKQDDGGGVDGFGPAAGALRDKARADVQHAGRWCVLAGVRFAGRRWVGGYDCLRLTKQENEPWLASR